MKFWAEVRMQHLSSHNFLGNQINKNLRNLQNLTETGNILGRKSLVNIPKILRIFVILQ